MTTWENKNRLTQAFWDLNPCNMSATWEQASSLRYNYTDRYLSTYLTQENFAGKRVLEVGCGQGFDTAKILKHCKSYVGIDLSGESIEIAKNEMKKFFYTLDKSYEFLEGDAENMMFQDETFDVVYSIGVLHHTVNFESALSEVLRVLKRDGIFISMVYRSYTPLWLILRAVRGFFHIPFMGSVLRAKLMTKLRTQKLRQTDSLSGTALLELIGCPIIHTFSRRKIKNDLSHNYNILESTSYRVGVDQMVRILPHRTETIWPKKIIDKLDDRFSKWLGFYLVTVAQKI